MTDEYRLALSWYKAMLVSRVDDAVIDQLPAMTAACSRFVRVDALRRESLPWVELGNFLPAAVPSASRTLVVLQAVLRLHASDTAAAGGRPFSVVKWVKVVAAGCRRIALLPGVTNAASAACWSFLACLKSCGFTPLKEVRTMEAVLVGTVIAGGPQQQQRRCPSSVPNASSTAEKAPRHALQPSAADFARAAMLAAVGEFVRLTSVETFRIPTHIHDVLEVPNAVGALLQGLSLPPRLPPSPGEETLRTAAMRPLIDSNDPRSFVSAMRHWSRVASIAHTIGSTFVTNRLQPIHPGWEPVNAGATVLFHALLNWLHALADQFPDNIKAFYMLIPLLNDIVECACVFDLPVALLSISSSGTGPRPPVNRIDTADLMNGGMPVPQPVGSPNGVYPSDVLHASAKLAVVVGILLDKMLADIDRIVSNAASSYAAASANPTQPSAALLTFLCSAMQPVVAVCGSLPNPPSWGGTSAQRLLTRALVCRMVESVAGAFVAAVQRAQQANEKAAATADLVRQLRVDLDALQAFATHHPLMHPAERKLVTIITESAWHQFVHN